MPKNKGKGGKNFRKGKKGADQDESKRELVQKGEGEEYAIVTKTLGGCHFEARCHDGIMRRCHVRGQLQKQKRFVCLGDLVLVSLREYQKGTGDIVYKYTSEDTRKLKSMGIFVDNSLDSSGDSDPQSEEKTNSKDVHFDFESI